METTNQKSVNRDKPEYTIGKLDSMITSSFSYAHLEIPVKYHLSKGQVIEIQPGYTGSTHNLCVLEFTSGSSKVIVTIGSDSDCMEFIKGFSSNKHKKFSKYLMSGLNHLLDKVIENYDSRLKGNLTFGVEYRLPEVSESLLVNQFGVVTKSGLGLGKYGIKRKFSLESFNQDKFTKKVSNLVLMMDEELRSSEVAKLVKSWRLEVTYLRSKRS